MVVVVGGLVAKSCLTLVTQWTVAHQTPLSRGFPRQEHWSGLTFPSLGDLPNPGIEPWSLLSPALAGRFFTTTATREAHFPYFEITSSPLESCSKEGR